MSEHLQALRAVLIQSLIALSICCCLSLWFGGEISTQLYNAAKELSNDNSIQISALYPLEGVLVNLRLSIYAAMILMLPSVFFSIAKFLFPGLLKKERHLFTCGCIAFFFSLILSLVFTMRLVYPLACHFLLKYNTQSGLISIWSASSIVSFFAHITFLTTALLFFFLIGFYLVLRSEIGPSFFSQKRKGFVVFALTFAALATPPDIMTQLIVAIPMLVLYELLFLIATLRKRGRNCRSKD